MRQPCRAHHQAKHQRQKVAAGQFVFALLFGCAVGVARIGLAVRRQATQRFGTLVVLVHFTRPALAGRGSVARQGGQFAAGRNNQPHIGVLRTQLANALAPQFAFTLQRTFHILQTCLHFLGAAQVGLHHLVLCRRVKKLGFQLCNLADLLAINGRGHGVAQLLVGQPGHGNQKRQQQHHVLRHLRPGDGTHAAQERAQQHAPQAQHDADLELHPRQARSDQPHAIDLRDHVGEGTQHRRQSRNDARPAPAKAHMKKIGHGVQPHGPQVRCNQHRHQTKPARPAQQVGQPTGLPRSTRKALQVQRPRETDERGRAHPVGGGRHAVVHGRYAPACYVVLVGI